MDYQTLVDASVVFQPGDASKSFSFTINDDSIVERDESLVVVITTATFAIIGILDQAAVTILNDDGEKYRPPTFTAWQSWSLIQLIPISRFTIVHY